MNIQILTKTFEYTNKNSIIFPFLAFKKELNQSDIFFKILFNLDQVNYSDIIIVDSKYHKNYWKNNENKIYIDFIKLKKYSNKLIYFDTTDSTGMIQSEIFNYINRYWKFQILKDKSLYKKSLYGGRIFSNYYHNEFNINDQNTLYSKPVDSIESDKISLAWNFGLADYSYKNKYFFFLRKILLWNQLFSFPLKKKHNKKNLLFATFNDNYSRQTIAFQRKKIRNFMKDVYVEKLPELQYHMKLSSSKCVISPFGWGEIAYRDFEAFFNKCTLIKPNMDHLTTWPNFFVKNETYVDFSWDFSDLQNVMDDIKLGSKKYEDISLNGYNTYHKYTSGKNAGKYFLEHLKNLLNE